MRRPSFIAMNGAVYWDSVRLSPASVDTLLDVFERERAAEAFNDLYDAGVAAGLFRRPATVLQYTRSDVPRPVVNLRGAWDGYCVYLETEEAQAAPGEPVVAFPTLAAGHEAVKAARASLDRLAELMSQQRGVG